MWAHNASRRVNLPLTNELRFVWNEENERAMEAHSRGVVFSCFRLLFCFLFVFFLVSLPHVGSGKDRNRWSLGGCWTTGVDGGVNVSRTTVSPLTVSVTVSTMTLPLSAAVSASSAVSEPAAAAAAAAATATAAAATTTRSRETGSTR